VRTIIVMGFFEVLPSIIFENEPSTLVFYSPQPGQSRSLTVLLTFQRTLRGVKTFLSYSRNPGRGHAWMRFLYVCSQPLIGERFGREATVSTTSHHGVS